MKVLLIIIGIVLLAVSAFLLLVLALSLHDLTRGRPAEESLFTVGTAAVFLLVPGVLGILAIRRAFRRR